MRGLALAGGSLNGTAAELVAGMHFNPVHHVPFIFADLVNGIGEGLGWDRAWAEVVAAVSSAIYRPSSCSRASPPSSSAPSPST